MYSHHVQRGKNGKSSPTLDMSVSGAGAVSPQGEAMNPAVGGLYFPPGRGHFPSCRASPPFGNGT